MRASVAADKEELQRAERNLHDVIFSASGELLPSTVCRDLVEFSVHLNVCRYPFRKILSAHSAAADLPQEFESLSENGGAETCHCTDLEAVHTSAHHVSEDVLNPTYVAR